MDTIQRKPCRKCLLRDMNREAYFKTMYDYIEQLDEKVKAPGELYEQRLLLCRECDRLTDGMCAVCGCYVELRAAIANNSCPAVHPRW